VFVCESSWGGRESQLGGESAASRQAASIMSPAAPLKQSKWAWCVILLDEG
jgi:hypothetical protein